MIARDPPRHRPEQELRQRRLAARAGAADVAAFPTPLADYAQRLIADSTASAIARRR